MPDQKKKFIDKIQRAVWVEKQDAVSQGVFGVPSFIVNGEHFWGNDRLDFLFRELESLESR